MTQITKGRDGWVALDVIPMAAGRLLRVTSHKWQRGGGLVTFATGLSPSADGFSYSCAAFQDFNKAIKTESGTRCSERTIRQHHAAAMCGIADVLAQANAQYATEEVAA